MRALRFVALMLVIFAGSSFVPREISAKESLIRIHVLSKFSWREAEVSGDGMKAFAEAKAGATQRLPNPGEAIRVQAVGGEVELEGGKRFARLEIQAGEGGLEVSGKGGVKRRFGGRLRVEARKGSLWFVEMLPIESYVRGVLGGEMPGDFPVEAQKAQAVMIRSYARSQRGRHAGEGYDFCDLTHCQVYGGLGAESGLRDEAVRATRSLVLTYGGKPVEALFHSTCGGHTSANQDVFGGRPLPYLQGVDDGEYCKASPHSEWSANLPLNKISATLAADESYESVASLSGFQPLEREPKGRIFSLRLDGPSRKTIATMDFLSLMGKAFGWNRLKSNWFDVEVKEGIAEFHGRGLGHGVGLCQWGARGMAEAGKRFDEILRHYFPGTKLERL